MASVTSPLAFQSDSRRAAARFDWPLLGSALALMLFGLMSLYSVGSVNPGNVFVKQITFIGIGLVPFSIFLFVPPNFWKRISSWLYILDILVLLAVFKMGKQINHSERWIILPGGFEFQPSELAKLLTIITLSSFYANRQETIDKISTLALGFLHVLVPCFLIFKQPHLGATLSIFIMWVGVSLIAGIPIKYLGSFLLAMGLSVFVALHVPALRSQIIHPYQDKRIHAMSKGATTGGKAGANQEEVKQAIQKGNYQTDRAAIAFGVGGASGVGFLHGEQKAGRFIPEQVNDFIVTVVGEEGGLVGCTLLLIAYGFFFYRIFLVMLNATKPFYRMIAAGVFVVLGFHTYVNIAMVLQLAPVVGLWLPFMSSGGTAIWLCMACVGLLLGIRRKQRPILF